MNLHKLHPQRKRKILKDISHTLSLYLDLSFLLTVDFPGGSDGKASAYNVGDPGSIPGSGRSPGEGNGHSGTLAWKIPWSKKPGRL